MTKSVSELININLHKIVLNIALVHLQNLISSNCFCNWSRRKMVSLEVRGSRFESRCVQSKNLKEVP